MADEKVNIIISLKDKASSGIKGFSGKLSKMKKAVFSLKGALIGLAIAGVAKLGSAFIKSAGALESYNTSFEVMLGSQEKAKKLMKEINKVAISTPFEQADIIKSTQSLLAFGVAEGKVIKKFKVLGDLSQGNKQKLDSLTRSYGKVQAKGKASMEEINMVTEAGVPIMGALAETMGVTTEEVMKLSSQGKISSEIFDRAMTSMTLEGGQFFQSMQKQSRTFQGIFSTVAGNVELVSQSIGTALLPMAKKAGDILNVFLGKIIEFTQTQQFADLMTLFADKIKQVVRVFKNWYQILDNLGILKAFQNGLKITLGLVGKLINYIDFASQKMLAVSEKVKGFFSRNKKEDDPEAIEAENPDEKNQAELDRIARQNEAKLALQKADLAKRRALQKKADDEMIANQKSTFNIIKGLAASNNKTLSAIGKAAAIREVAIQTPVAISKAMGSAPPPFNFILAGLVAAEMARQAASIAGVKLADGGIVQARPGGVNATIGEGGQDEAVIPLDEAGGFGTTINITVNGGFLGNDNDAREFAEKVDEELFKLTRAGQSQAFG